jgi:uncharacterized LabA/DUF88 family protein
MYNKKIYIRENGENKEIDDGRNIRDILLTNKFYPEQINVLEDVLNSIRNSSYGIGEFDFIYICQLKKYLYERAKESYEQRNLLEAFLEIENMFAEIRSKNRDMFRSESEGVNDSLNKLELLIKKFIEEFKKVHNL